MLRKELRLCLGIFLFSLIGINAAFAQGKIAGNISDAITGDPLIGVNVIIEETNQGTVSDVNGDYIILNVRPGTYTIQASYIGFQTQRIDGIRTSTGQTTRYNIEMREEVIEGQEVLVQAERPLIQKDLTASKKVVGAEEIDALPVEGFLGVLTTQAGVNTGPSGEIHIRGGRSNEVAYLVDGMSVSNPFNTNGLATSVAADAIQEMTVISGAFNAEYGKAMSGIVNLVTKEGGDQYSGTVAYYVGDNVTRHNELLMRPDGLRATTRTLEASLSGPLPLLRKVKFFASYRGNDDIGHLYGERRHLPSDSANFNPDSDRLAEIQEYIPDYDNPDAYYYELHGKPWFAYTDSTEIPRERVNMNPASSYNFVGKLSMRPFSGTKLEYSFINDGYESTPFSFSNRYNPDGVGASRDNSTNHTLSWTHTLNSRWFYTLKASLQNHAYSSYLYKDPYDPRYVSSGNIVAFPGNNFLMGGNSKGHVYEDARSLRIKFDMTRQFGAIHEVKGGLEYQGHSLDRDNFVVLYDGVQYRVPTVLPADESPSHDSYSNQEAAEWSAYLQDKLEFDDFIINVGLRYERFDPKAEYIPDLLDPKGPLEPTEIKQFVLPRVGVSFPITDTGIIHFSYGHFAQMPSLRSMYLNPEFEFPVNSAPTFGNANLRPERTVQYEIGLQQQIAENVAFDITGFFKDIRDYLATQTIRYSTVAGEDLYSIQLNRDYAAIKGVTFSLTKRRSRNGLLSATLDYTYQVAEGNNISTNAFFFNVLSGRENELELVPLSFDQRHIISSTITLTKPRNWGLSFIGQAATGYPYTPMLIDQKIDQLPNQERKPMQFKLDMQASKTLTLGSLDARAFVRVFNLLDRLNERFVFDDTGRATYSLNGQRGTHASWEPFYGQLGINDLDTYNTRPQYFSAPREVRVGLMVNF